MKCNTFSVRIVFLKKLQFRSIRQWYTCKAFPTDSLILLFITFIYVNINLNIAICYLTSIYDVKYIYKS